MLARPEIGSREHILLWLASQPKDRKYYWPCTTCCACAQYSEACGEPLSFWVHTQPVIDMNAVARDVSGSKTGTYGKLYRALRKTWR